MRFLTRSGDNLVLEHDGSLYSCNHYVYPEYRLGRISELPLREMLWSDRQIAFGNEKLERLTKQCLSCEFRFACNGGCPKHRFATSRHGEAGHNYFCESYTMFFNHAKNRLEAMAEELVAGRPAAYATHK